MTDAPRHRALFGTLALMCFFAVVLFVLWLPHSQGHEGWTVVITAALATAAVQVAFRRLRASTVARADRHQDEGDDAS